MANQRSGRSTRRVRPPSHYALGWLPRWARLTPPKLANTMLRSKTVGRIAKAAAGVDQRRSLELRTATGRNSQLQHSRKRPVGHCRGRRRARGRQSEQCVCREFSRAVVSVERVGLEPLGEPFGITQFASTPAAPTGFAASAASGDVAGWLDPDGGCPRQPGIERRDMDVQHHDRRRLCRSAERAPGRV